MQVLASRWGAQKNTTVVFINGALIMVLELIGARIITPYVGSSSFVWTAIIGVMLAALAAGYSWGGKNADKTRGKLQLSTVFFISAVLVLLTAVLYTSVMQTVTERFGDIRTQSVLGCLLLFAPAAFFMGSVSPYVAKRNTTSIEKAGNSIGSIYAYGTAGSIVGTFLCGFWLTSYFSNKHILIGIAVSLFALSFAEGWKFKKVPLVANGMLILVLIGGVTGKTLINAEALYETDTAYSYYSVSDTSIGSDSVRVIATDKLAWQSGITLKDPQKPAFSYIKRFTEVMASHPAPNNVLLLGGGAYTLPTILAPQFPSTHIDVVEIDPALEKIAKDYFLYTSPTNVQIHNEDARVYTENSTKKYDIIYVDVYSSIRPPFHLTTKEFVELLKNRLTTNGIVVANVIGSFEETYSQFPASQLATYAHVFEHTGIMPASNSYAASDKQNMILFASKNPLKNVVPTFEKEFVQLGAGTLLTDSFAPVDKLIGY